MLETVIHELKKIIPQFEVRKEQQEMMESVLKAMKEETTAAVHAPTGTGKSLGYLIPFLVAKLEDPGFKMTINTYTLNLQAQLVKDLELIATIYHTLRPLEKPITYTILKGKTNYYCQKQFEDNQDDLPVSFTKKLGDRVDELRAAHVVVDQQNLGMKITPAQWELLSVNECKRKECPFFETCDFYQSYYGVESDIVISNHALYFNRALYTPEAWDSFAFHVFDEAHKMEKVIFDVLTVDLSTRKLETIAKKGLSIAYKHEFEQQKITEWANAFLFKNPTLTKFTAGLEAIKTRLEDTTAATLKTLNYKNIDKSIQGLVNTIENWQKEMYRSFIDNVVSPEKKEDPAFTEDKTNWIRSFQLIQEFKSTLSLGEEKQLLWVEKNAYDELLLRVTPTSISHMPSLFKRGILFTSGTLAQDGTNKHFTDRVNVEITIDKVLPTPFPLHEQTLVYASRTTNPKARDYEDQLAEEVWALLQAGELNTFILFTSHYTMERVHAKLKPRLLDYARTHQLDLDIWLQDKSNHKAIMDSFKNLTKHSVLFGTLSYFEGIDLQRKALTQVILTRLPFSVYTYPLQEILDRNEGYSKWEALIRFEQAFGRLIRTADDYGTFAILDKRLYDAYNQPFRDFFSNEQITITNSVEQIKEFYKKRT